MTSEDRSPVTVLGLGRMGVALAGAFVDAGHPTTVWNRTPARADGLVARGAVRAASPADAASASRLVIVCVTTYEDVHDILGRLGGVLHGRTLVTMNTGTPRGAGAVAGWAAQHGVAHLDAAIMNVPQAIGLPDTLLFYSGSEESFTAHRATLQVLGGDTTYLGTDPGLAKLYEMAVGSTLLPTLVAFLHGAALLTAAKVEAAALIPYTTKWLEMTIASLPGIAEVVDSGEYATDVASLGIFAEGVAHEIEVAQEVGLRTDWLQPLAAILDQGVAEGRGADSIAGLIEVLRRPAPAT